MHILQEAQSGIFTIIPDTADLIQLTFCEGSATRDPPLRLAGYYKGEDLVEDKTAKGWVNCIFLVA